MDRPFDRDPAVVSPRPRLGDWIWRPWYAKLWWFAIPCWWMAMAVATTSPALSAFFSTAFAGFLNVVFYPFAALLVLGVGFVPAWLDVWRAQWDAEPPMVDDSDAYWRDGNDDHCIDEIGPCLDPFDPRSVALWVGSPTNQHSPSDLPNQQY